jgi:two-component system chemotaxis sensor kinase CheA
VAGADDEFLKALRATFRIEASEHLQAIGIGLLQLEKITEPAEQLPVIETVFRAAHSLKGAARAVELTDIESVCQSLENLFAAWKRRESTPTQSALDTAHEAVNRMSEAIGAEMSAARSAVATQPSDAQVAPKPPTPPAAGPEPETVRVSVSSLDARLVEAEEMLSAKLSAGQRAVDLSALAAEFDPWRKEWERVAPQARALRRPANGAAANGCSSASSLVDFFDWTHDYLRSLETKVITLRRSAEEDHLVVSKLVDDLLENSKKLLMLPLATLGTLLPKVVRDLCRDQGKSAALTLCGEDVQIDKRILEELKDPLIHILRNCVDHGIETPEARRRAGKPSRAAITLVVRAVDGNQVELAVSDDGAGIDVENLKAAAVRRGIIAAEAAERLSDHDALALVFEADLSTSPLITEVSGRGLGLAIVREKTEKLGGRVALDSHRGEGTTLRMTLPLTLATSRGVLVECAQRLFVVPTSQVERVMQFKRADVLTVEGRDTLSLNERAIALVDLADVLQLPPAKGEETSSETTPALVLGTGEQRLAFSVDAVLGEQEVLIRRLAKPLSRVRNIAGATVLGSGEVAPILNVQDLLKSARHVGAARRSDATVAAAAPADESRTKVLVAEDSITSRMLLKGILESAGYNVKTAVDGMEAFTALRSERFDVVVSDVEMPRLNGFDLTARIRGDRALSELPVVLVTALESREDRERGVDVGANAYLVKSSLDQSNLLEALRRLT